jgi:hypothetical protein
MHETPADASVTPTPPAIMHETPAQCGRRAGWRGRGRVGPAPNTLLLALAPLRRASARHRHCRPADARQRCLTCLSGGHPTPCLGPPDDPHGTQYVVVDADHRVPYPNWPTCECPVRPNCRRHHHRTADDRPKYRPRRPTQHADLHHPHRPQSPRGAARVPARLTEPDRGRSSAIDVRHPRRPTVLREQIPGSESVDAAHPHVVFLVETDPCSRQTGAAKGACRATRRQPDGGSDAPGACRDHGGSPRAPGEQAGDPRAAHDQGGAGPASRGRAACDWAGWMHGRR